MVTRSFLKTIEADILKAVAPVAKRHNVEIRFTGGSFTDSNASLKLEIATVAEDGTVSTRKADDFRRLAKFYGLKATDLGREFGMRGEKFTISGLSPRAKKFPVLAIRDGTTYKFAAEDVVRALQ